MTSSNDAHDAYRISKTQKKRDSEALQDLGEELAELSPERVKKIPMSERLLEALLEHHRLTKHEARRRQLQFIGRLMRDEDTAPIRAALDALEGHSRAENARLHRLEQLRSRLLEDESVLTEIGNDHPGADLARLRQLRRNALKEYAENRPPRAFREIFRMLRELQEEGPPPGNEAFSNNSDDAEHD